MNCKHDGGAVELVDATENGPGNFSEEYRCVECRAYGYLEVSGADERLTGMLE